MDFASFASLGLGSFPRQSTVEDTVEYYVHLVPSSTSSQNDVKLELEKLLPDILKSVEPLTDDFIWQRDEFNLKVTEKDGITCLHGKIEFGESIDDEWFTVFLLREISKKFPQLWIRVVDTDGEFLLIEAAHALPKWLSPEVADNRIWITNGSLRIVPRSKEDRAAAKAGHLRSLSIKDALKFLEKFQKDLLHIQIVEEEAFYRISNYPASLKEHFHRARVTVPRTVAKILHERPKLISTIVETFCLRDPVQLKLKQQVFRPPRPFILPGKESPQYPASELGMKLTCGLELLVSGNKQKTEARLATEAKAILNSIAACADGSSDSTLPSDKDIKLWDHRADSEDWLNVDYEEFEANMAGTTTSGINNQARGTSDPLFERSAFNDKEQQDKLKKMVENFEKFMNDDSAGFEGARFSHVHDGFNSDDDDDLSDDEGDISTDEEDRDASFDEREFSKMMREMMGLPAESKPHTPPAEEEEISDDDGEEMSIRQTMAKMEEELVAAGALDPNRPGANIDEDRGRAKYKQPLAPNKSDAELNYEIARHMLESLKTQGGDAGPAANMLRSMGMVMPRDDGEEEGGEEQKADKKK
ncbi:hypothetical protein H072_1978 [Dactylellina haptotyla CBS 200.50]|uniref:Uncharacterized protein n=1 Tax=Dactylellina haptotyla (strain CBS 200.50) TaxID=1284197 RepID=S8AM71_DACHA|nr:hypothetical protein H072_1978 [Dactylellina haptotyla CBS 200.50]